MGYKGRHAKGEILVSFRNNCGNKNFARIFGKAIGYELSDEEYERGTDCFIYKTKVGKEKEACERFEELSDFVELACRRDVKLESRWKDLENAIEMLRDIHDNVELPDKEYTEKIKEIADYLLSLGKG